VALLKAIVKPINMQITTSWIIKVTAKTKQISYVHVKFIGKYHLLILLCVFMRHDDEICPSVRLSQRKQTNGWT